MCIRDSPRGAPQRQGPPRLPWPGDGRRPTVRSSRAGGTRVGSVGPRRCTDPAAGGRDNTPCPTPPAVTRASARGVQFFTACGDGRESRAEQRHSPPFSSITVTAAAILRRAGNPFTGTALCRVNRILRAFDRLLSHPWTRADLARPIRDRADIMSYCSGCGAPAGPGRFCVNCGSPLTPADPPGQPPGAAQEASAGPPPEAGAYGWDAYPPPAAATPNPFAGIPVSDYVRDLVAAGLLLVSLALPWDFQHDATARIDVVLITCLLYTSPSPRDRTRSRMPSSA